MDIGFISKTVKGKEGNVIGYDANGKVIVFKGSPLNIGYAEITNIVEDKGNYYICKGKNIPYDYYKDIEPNQFIKVLKNVLGYKVAFRRNECNLTDEQMIMKVHIRQVCLYNVELKTIIVINEYSEHENVDLDIRIMCPGIDEKISRAGCIFTNEGSRFSVYSIQDLKVYYPVHYIHNKILKEPEKHRFWKNNIVDFGLSEFNNMVSMEYLRSIENKDDLYLIFEEGSAMRELIS